MIVSVRCSSSMLRRHMLNIRAPHRSDPGFPDSRKSLHIPRSNSRERTS